MSYDAIDVLKHITIEIEYLSKFSLLTFDEIINDETLKRAIVRSIEIIGEAVKKLPYEVKKNYNSVEWKKISGMRDKLIHDYFGIDYQILIDVVNNKIPKLKNQVDNVLKNLELTTNFNNNSDLI